MFYVYFGFIFILRVIFQLFFLRDIKNKGLVVYVVYFVCMLIYFCLLIGIFEVVLKGIIELGMFFVCF